MKAYTNLVYDSRSKECTLDLYLPDGVNGEMPIFMGIHGGGLESGDKSNVEMVRLAETLTKNGIAMASVNYRMYPSAHYPDYLNDAANAMLFLMKKCGEYADFSYFAVGGQSAGGYITQMLYFNKALFANVGVDSKMVNAYIMDAGQPTTHYNILRYERGVDSRAVVVDAAAPISYLKEQYKNPENEPYVAIYASDNDMINRLEQNKMLATAMLHFGFPEDKLQFHCFEGYGHCGYINGEQYLNMVLKFLLKAFKK